MSIWTHVNASFRIDGFSHKSKETLEDIFGKTVLFESPSEVWDEYHEHPERFLPCGSEGSLQISIWDNPDDSCLFCNQVTVFGDLRDRDSSDKINDWFRNIIAKDTICFRQAICEICIPYMEHKVLMLQGESIIEFNYNYDEK